MLQMLTHRNMKPNKNESITQRELAWHNQNSYKRTPLNNILYRAPAFDVVTKSGFNFLNLSEGDWILDFGGGEGKETLDLVKQGMIVVNADLSTTQLQRAQKLVKSGATQAKVYFVQADAHNLPFARATFHGIYGKAILHHLDVHMAAREVYRLLSDGGKASFAEPMAHHPFFFIARAFTPGLRTVDEHPFTDNATCTFVRYFDEEYTTNHFLVAPFAYLFRIISQTESLFRWLHEKLQKFDSWLFKRIPKLRKYAWYRVVNVRKYHTLTKPDN